jgi:hypothetical protein
MEYYSALKRNELSRHERHRAKECKLLHVRSQSEKAELQRQWRPVVARAKRGMDRGFVGQ